MKKYHFTTIVSKTHLFKIIAMYQSLNIHCEDFCLFILCVDHEVYDILKTRNWENAQLFELKDVEDKELIKAKSNRTIYEYIWTLKSSFLLYIMKNHHDARYYAHLDSDLYFFSNPEQIFEEAPQASLYLTDHHNSERFMHYYDLTGKFNSGFVGFKHDPIGWKGIEEWKTKCLKHCSIDIDPVAKTYGDQRYIEDWPERFDNVHVVKSIGANAALWNIEKYKVSKQNGKVYLDHEPLIFYHFSGLYILGPQEFNLCYFYHIDDVNTVQFIYLPYVEELAQIIKEVQEQHPWFTPEFVDKEKIPTKHLYDVSK
ncbi:hypothetical protein WD019_00610 [Fictibacillus sp. Mic-4]|uniref:hypothetical protein n=1 Tax=Fictibacillus sp. Mic-4 TaxID=3132826 RepID=UPI003CE6C528